MGEEGVLGGGAQSMMVAACSDRAGRGDWQGSISELGQTGLPDGLDMRDAGKGGSKDESQACEPRSQCWCHLRRYQDWARSRFGAMKLDILHWPTPRLGTEKIPVFANIHINLVFYLSGICASLLTLRSGVSLVIPLRPAPGPVPPFLTSY